jgi:hypothetical protein
MIWLHPPPPPLCRQQIVSLSQYFCVSPIELTDGRGCWRGRAWNRIIRPQGSLGLYKSFNPSQYLFHCANLTHLGVIRWLILNVFFQKKSMLSCCVYLLVRLKRKRLPIEYNIIVNMEPTNGNPGFQSQANLRIINYFCFKIEKAHLLCKLRKYAENIIFLGKKHFILL